MSDKAKRKSNPRRRLLIRLIIGIVIIVALISAGYYALRPKGAQIVFIAPDDNGIDNLWIADLNNPENPQQIRTIEGYSSTSSFQFSDSGDIALVITQQDVLWIDLVSGQSVPLEFPGETHINFDYALHPNGQWIAYATLEIASDDYAFYKVMLYDSQTDETHFVADYHPWDRDFFARPYPYWVGHSDVLAFVSSEDQYNVRFYSLTDHELLEMRELSPYGTNFNDAATIYADGNFIIFTGSERLEFRYSDAPETVLSATDHRAFILDWHPDNEHALIIEGTMNTDDNPFYSLILHNAVTGSQTIIRHEENDNMVYDADFNAEGTQIVFSVHNDSTDSTQVMLYDMETREEIPLPLFGRNPQWVNGGR